MESLYPNVDVHVRSFDAADEKALSGVIDEVISKYGRLDIFFANAGVVGQPKIFTEIDGEGFLNTMRVNALGYVHPSLKQDKHNRPRDENNLTNRYKQCLPSSQTRGASNEDNLRLEAIPQRLDHRHGVCSRSPLQRRFNRLLRLKGSSCIDRADGLVPARWVGYPHERDLSWAY